MSKRPSSERDDEDIEDLGLLPELRKMRLDGDGRYSGVCSN